MRPILVLNPPDDAAFVALANGALDAGASSPEGLQEALRHHHPNALVRERMLSGERQTMWYVYREGSWINGHAGEG